MARPVEEIHKALNDPDHPYSCHGCIHLAPPHRENPQLTVMECMNGYDIRAFLTAQASQSRPIVAVDASRVHPIAFSETCKETR